MGGPKTKTSRKGKKAWRKNIDTTQEQDVIAKQSYEERHGPAAESLADSQLFFVDKGADEEQAAAVVRGAKRKRTAEYKPLRSQLIINAAHLAKAVPHPAKKHKVNNLPASKRGAQGQQLAEQQGAQQQPQQQLAAAAGGTVDRAQAVIDARKAAGEHPLDLWGDEDLFSSQQQEQQPGKKRKVPGRGRGPPAQRVKAVAVDAAGCSFNPDKELHQDALAVLVAQEHKKELKKEMMPKAPPPTVPGASQPVDELEALLDVGGGADNDENEIDVEGEGDSDAEEDGKGDKQQKAARKKTKTDRNKEKKRRAADKEAEARRKLKAQRAQIDNVRKVQTDLEELQAEQRLRQQRREIAKAEKAAVLPPRLGKHKFEPPSVQVLTTDEINGSLRRLRACPMVTLDRFKSLQQRGLIEPRRPLAQAKQRRVVEYEKNARNEKAVASQQELRDLQQQNNQTRKKAAAASKAQ